MAGLRELAAEVRALEPDAETCDAVLRRVYDSLAAVEVGRHVPDVAPLAGENGPAARIRFATAAGRATETDDIHVASCSTIGAVVVPAAVLAAGDRDGLVAAVAAGYEAAARLALAVGGASLVYAGRWTTLLCAPVGVAAAVARGLGLDLEQTVSAVALAASRAVAAAPEPAAGAIPRWWAIGSAAADGWLAAHAARAGVAADPGSVVLPAPLDEERLRAPLARPAVLDVDTKAFPSARQTLAAVEAAVEAAGGLAPGDVARVEVGVPAQVLAMVDRSGSPSDRLDSFVDVRFQVALALCHPDTLFDAVRASPSSLEPPALARRVEAAADRELTAAFPALGGRAAVTTRAGAAATAVVREPSGSAARPFGWTELERKWQRVAAASGVDGTRLQELRAAATGGDPAALAAFVDAR